MAPKEATARFYFELTYYLAKEDLTMISKVEKENVYLCLSVASLMKDKITRQNNDMKKIQRDNERLLNNYR